MLKVRKILYLIFLIFIMTGFRMFPRGNEWSIDIANPKLWVVVCPTTITFGSNDLPSGDPLYNQTVTFSQVLTSILDDFSNVPNSFLILSDASTDGAYNTTIAARRTINICPGSVPGTATAYAKIRAEAGKPVGCDVTLGPNASSSLKVFVSTLTHELGHCIGLDHPQDTTHAIMSYYHDKDLVRLQTDDKMGLMYMYPDNAENSKESMTFGLSCSPRN